jgi:tRNA threonylcarbamoyladenosine biosynthesis protein TsaE
MLNPMQVPPQAHARQWADLGEVALPSLASMQSFGQRIAALLASGDCVTLSGDLGVGKTTLAAGILQGLGFQGEVCSPTYPLIIPYAPPETRIGIWHIDLYRLETKQELAGLGLEEALLDNALLVEWPECGGVETWPHALHLRLRQIEDEARVVTALCAKTEQEKWQHLIV